jgi:signal transduction histidine kinase
VPSISTEPTTSGARRAEQIAVLLDESARILSVNIGLAGSSFLGLAEKKRCGIHEQLHPGCDGECYFRHVWKKAWQSLSANDSVEWEIEDPVLGKLLRLNLARPPSARDVEVDRRQGYALLTITDITKHRREYESLIRREQTLLRILREQGVDPEIPASEFNGVADAEPVAGATSSARQYRSISRQAILAQEEERRRIANELHDSLAQSAGVIKYTIEATIARLLRNTPDADVSSLEAVVDQVRGLVDEIRRISNNLAPSMLEDFGLCAALRGLCSEFQSPTFDLNPACDACVDESGLPDVVRFTVYRVAQEALHNIAKHSLATKAGVELRMTGDGLRLSIRDNGKGFDLGKFRQAGSPSATGSGLGNMRERVMATGGQFTIETAPGQGVAVQAEWPAETLDLLGDESVLDRVDGDR